MPSDAGPLIRSKLQLAGWCVAMGGMMVLSGAVYVVAWPVVRLRGRRR